MFHGNVLRLIDAIQYGINDDQLLQQQGSQHRSLHTSGFLLEAAISATNRVQSNTPVTPNGPERCPHDGGADTVLASARISEDNPCLQRHNVVFWTGILRPPLLPKAHLSSTKIEEQRSSKVATSFGPEAAFTMCFVTPFVLTRLGWKLLCSGSRFNVFILPSGCAGCGFFVPHQACRSLVVRDGALSGQGLRTY